jgi:hypothetical protein
VRQVGAVGCPSAGTSPESAQPGQPAVNWQACLNYSDDVLRMLVGKNSDRIEEFRQLWARTGCGTVSVPLDYDDPGGQQITVALTRLKAADQAHRLGSLAFNPGGPGDSGYLMPIRVMLQNTKTRTSTTTTT